jgi:DNA repair protein RadC
MLPPAMQLGLRLNVPALEARERRERLLESGARLTGGEYLALLLAEGVPEAEAQERAGQFLAARARQEMEADNGGR